MDLLDKGHGLWLMKWWDADQFWSGDIVQELVETQPR